MDMLIDLTSHITMIFSQKNYKEITAADEIDKKTLAKMKKNAARDADII